MSPLPARLSIVTLGVEDLARSIAFYEALGWERRSSSVPDVIAWFSLGSCYLGVFPRSELAADAAIADPGPPPRFGGVTLAMNLESDAAVEAALEVARAAGARILKPAEMAIFGGFRATSPIPTATRGRSPTTRASRSTRTAGSRSPSRLPPGWAAIGEPATAPRRPQALPQAARHLVDVPLELHRAPGPRGTGVFRSMTT